MLFLSMDMLGLSTNARALESATATRPDLDAVHVRLRPPLWARVLGKRVPMLPGGWDQHAYRHAVMWRRVIGRWLDGVLDLDRFDAVHVMTQVAALAPAERCRERGVRLIVNIDATGRGECREFGYSEPARAPFIGLERAIFDRADLVAAWSRWAERSLIGDYRLDPERVVLARPGVSGWAPGARGPRAGADVGDDGPARILFAGHDWERKGGPELLRLHQRRFADRCELHVVSGGVRPRSWARNVVWHGPVERAVLMERIMPRMRALVLPTHEDTFGWVALEAAASGVPVIASRLAALPEIVQDGRTGFLVEPGSVPALESALDRLLSAPALAGAMGLASREHARTHFDAGVTYSGLLDRVVDLVDPALRGVVSERKIA